MQLHVERLPKLTAYYAKKQAPTQVKGSKYFEICFLDGTEYKLKIHNKWLKNSPMFEKTSRDFHWSPTQKLSKTPSCGFFWRLHYISMIDELTGHWWLIPTLVLLPSVKVKEWWAKSFNPLFRVLFPWLPAPSLDAFRKSLLLT